MLQGITKGSVAQEQVVVVDVNKNISGFKDVGLTGKLTTATFNLGGTDVNSSAEQINKLDGVIGGTVSNGKVVIAGDNGDISGFRDVTITRTVEAANLDISGTTTVNSITSKSNDGSILKLQSSSSDMQINDVLGKIEFQSPDEATGDVSTMVGASIVAKSEGDFSSTSNPTTLSFMTGGSAEASERMTIDSTGNVVVSGGDVTVNGSQQITSNLNVGGNLVLGLTTLNEDSLGVLESITIGESSNGKVITQGTTGLTKIGATNGPEIFDIASHNTTSSGLKLGGTLVTASASELNTLHDVSEGTVSGSSAVVTDSNKDISGFRDVSLTGTLTTASLTLGTKEITASAEDINKIKSVTNGSVTNNKAVVAGDTKSISGFLDVGLTGKLTTGTINLGGTDISANATEINYLAAITKGTATSKKALVTDENTDISGLANVSATGTITASTAVSTPSITAGNINISSSNIGIGNKADLVSLTETSVTLKGTLVTPSLKLGGVDVSAPAEKLNIMENVISTSGEINLLNTAESGKVVDEKAVIYGADGQIKAKSFESTTTLSVAGKSLLGEIDITGNAITTTNASGISLSNNNLTTSGTVDTGTLDATTINATGNVTIDGDLTVNGTTTTINTANIVVQDPIMVLSSGAVGSASVDSGLIIERG